MTVRRWLLIGPSALLLAAAAYTGWLAWQVQADLRGAEASAREFSSALETQDPDAREQAAADLAERAAEAKRHTSTVWWRALTQLPVLGDDAEAVQAMSTSLDVIARDAVTPLGESVDSLGRVLGDGRLDLDAVEQLEDPVGLAHRALVAADDDLTGLDSDGYVDALRSRFDRYAALVRQMRSGLASAETAVDVLPAMAGADGPRDYLLLFQNNAEVRATGGMPGSWALLHAEGGKVTMARQGTAGDFPTATSPVLPLTDEEQQVYGEELGLYFQNPGWTPDFPRAAELWHAHWDARFPKTPIDGVVALDPVGMSYLLDGTGPVTVDDVTLTSDNAVAELLSRPYIEEGPVAQNAFFAQASEAVFSAATGSLASPVAFVGGLNRAAGEGRLLVGAVDDRVAAKLAGTQVEGALASDDGSTPHVDIGLNDLTGSKMSYYLRYNADVDAVSCRDGVQQLAGSVTLNQVISPATAAGLPASVTGGGFYGTDPGSQYVMVRIYGPYAGTIEQVGLNGRSLKMLTPTRLAGRPVVSVDVLLTSRRDAVLTWHGSTGLGQTSDIQFRVTPGMVPGAGMQGSSSAC